MIWLSYHIYYHEDLDRLLRGLIRPVVMSLWSSGRLEKAFFVRFFLGGPHLRLRVNPPAGKADVAFVVQDATRRFLAEEPSRRTLDWALIERTNRAILASDPFESDANIYPDNSWRTCAYAPETQRYGGTDLVAASLSFFALSSLEALRFVEVHAASHETRLFSACSLLLRQALGFSRDREELSDLLRNAQESWGQTFPLVIRKGERVLDERREVFRALLKSEVELLLESDAQVGTGDREGELMSLGSRRLSQLVGSATARVRKQIGASQLHMTANRIGLLNAEEVYISRLLTGLLEPTEPTGQLEEAMRHAWARSSELPVSLDELCSRAVQRWPAP